MKNIKQKTSIIIPPKIVKSKNMNKLEKKLQELKNEWENIFQAIGQPALIIDPKYNIISANRAAVKASKLSTNEIIGTKCYKIFHKTNTPDKCCPVKKMIKSKHLETAEMTISALHGTYLISCTPIFNKAGKLQKIIQIATDITKQREMSSAVKKSEERYRAIFEGAVEGILITNIKTKKFLYANSAICKMLGYKKKELIKMEVSDIDPKDSFAKVISEFETQARGNKTLFTNIPCLKKDGSIIHVNIATSYMLIDGKECNIGFFSDITEKNIAEEERLNNLKYFESMHKISSIIEKTVDFEDTLNKALNAILQILEGDRVWLLYPLDPESPSFNAPFEVTRPEYPGIFIKNEEIPMNPMLKDMMKTILNSDVPITYSPNTRPMPGAEVHTKYSIKTQMCIAIKTKLDKPWVLGIHQCSHIREWSTEDQKIFKDIAEKITSALNNIILFKNLQKSEESLKTAHEELEKRYEELKKVDKIKDDLLSDVTHELKTPVAKQNMQLELLKRFLKGKGILESAGGIIKTMESSIERQNNVIENILNLARLERGGKKYKFESMRLDLAIQKVIDEYKYVLESYEFKIETLLPEIEISSDKEMLFHVFANLINNAIKFGNIETTPYLGIFLEKKDTKVIIKIKDNGIGLTKEENEHAFERFYQASSSAPGSGIGLSIAKIIVDDLKGKIWLESEGKNKGTTAFVELPYYPLRG